MEQAPDSSTRTSMSRLAAMIALVAIACGAVLRVIEFTRGRPLWLDESMLSLNIASRSFAQLARPLDYDQTAPILYLWIERAAILASGVSERSLRLFPFVAGLALLPLTWLAARRLVSDTAAAVAAVLVALSVTLVTFGSEAKQYGVDPLATIVVVLLASRVARAPDDRGAWGWLIAGGVGCLLLSQPAVFALGGVACALGAELTVRRSRAARRFALVGVGVWSAAFAALYIALYRGTATSEYMRGFWEGTFLDVRASDFALRLRMFAYAAFSAPTLAGSAIVPEWVMALAWMGGVATLWRRSRFAALLVALPLTLAAVACGVGRYAVMDRLFLFNAPLLAIAFGALVAFVVELAPSRARVGGLAAACAALALFATPTHVRRIAHPVFFAVGKQVVADVDTMSRGEPVYVAARSFPLWVFYTTDWRSPDAARLVWAASIAGAGAPAHNNAPVRERVRIAEARTLSRRYHGRVEIVGLPTGRQYRTSTRTMNPTLAPADYALPLQPDTGWAEIEVDRMAAVAHARVWVFGSHMFALDGAEPGLVAELQRRGVRLITERRQGTTVAYHVEFPSEP
jgi:4-amino-4-deoxy-L-arabinose transferase-like glycosyltransferase